MEFMDMLKEWLNLRENERGAMLYRTSEGRNRDWLRSNELEKLINKLVQDQGKD